VHAAMLACARSELPKEQEIPMNTICKYIYAALLVLSALNYAPSLVSAQDEGGRFTLPHEVHWQNAIVPAGDYSFTLQSVGPAEMLMLKRLSGGPASFMLLVNDADAAADSGRAGIMLASKAGVSYVSAMNLPQLDVALHFAAPRIEKEIARAQTISSASR
jgi:hypothetical protein